MINDLGGDAWKESTSVCTANEQSLSMNLQALYGTCCNVMKIGGLDHLVIDECNHENEERSYVFPIEIVM